MMFPPSILAIASVMSIVSSAAIPNGCTATYQVQSGESCFTIVNRFQNFTASDLYRWNPEIGLTCQQLQAFAPVCINLPPNQPGAPFKAGDIYAASWPPVPQQPDIVPGCKYFEYSTSDGPGFAQILKTNGITAEQWNDWNWPSRNGSLGAVFANYFSCVAV